MADQRVRIPKDKEHIINRLFKNENNKGIFNLKADIITFAASIGFRLGRRVPFSDSLEPIRQEVFERHGYDTVINLIAISASNDPKILMNTDAAENLRITIFEEYANGGFEVLIEELKGTVSILDHILLMIKSESSQKADDDSLLLSKFL